MTVLILISLVGAASALWYLVRRKWIDALVLLIATAALAGMAASMLVGDDEPDFASISGDGMRAAEWADRPARQLRWQIPADPGVRLDFPRAIQLGRMFTLTVTLPAGANRKLQLLAENGKLLAEATGAGTTLSVQWLPPVAEVLTLKAQLLDATGKPLAQGPVPFEVLAPVPLQIQGRFGAPSFDTRALNQLLAQSEALLDWRVTLGKVATRSETPREAIVHPDLMVVDAAYVERLSESARASLLGQVAGGTPLLILGASANEPQAWARMLELNLREQAEVKPNGATLALSTAAYLPSASKRGGWTPAGDRIWSRPWEHGRIVWLGVSEWHRYAITEPRALGLWWQQVLDIAGVRHTQKVNLLDPEEMPLPGQRLALCAQGVDGDVTFPSLKQTLTWQRRTDKADAACVAVWPAAPGWLTFEWGGATARMYVYADTDWLPWQKAQRHEATLRYSARTPVALTKSKHAVPTWPFALLFAAAMLLLWWRERR